MSRFTAALTGSVLATYLLVALGATTAATGDGSFAAGHYLVAVLVGLLLLTVAALAILERRDRLVQVGAVAVVVVYPLQALLGMVGLTGGTVFAGQLHLLGGLAVFGLLLWTLVWHLDREVGPRSLGDGTVTPSAGTSTPESTAATAQQSAEVDVGQTGGTVASSGAVATIKSRTRAYVALTKPRLMWLLSLLAVGGMALATITGATLDGVTVVATLAGGVLAIGASATFNHVYERDRDSRMDRTADRPVATQTVGPRRASVFGTVLFAASMGILLAFVNPLAALLTAVAAVYYAVGYTVLLKPTTKYNTVLGGGAGALPAVIGWAAVTGSVGLPALVLAAVVFCWTPAHFYNLAIVYREDYAAGGYPMLPVVDGIDATRRRILYWLGTTLGATAVLGAVAGFGYVYVTAATAVGAVFLWSVVKQYRLETPGAALRSFHASNAFLGVVLVAILVETVVI